ncbi:MAG: M1 family metallopeptidase [Gemmatimonadales bacterium]
MIPILRVALWCVVIIDVSAVASQASPRAIRHTVPITNTFRAGLRAGTRDSSGRPGPRYWQLRTDYRIQAQLQPEEGSVEGQETVTITNPSDSTLTAVILRLDQNRFTASGIRVRTPPSVTDGIVLHRVVANGVVVDVAKLIPPGFAPLTVRIPLDAPIPAHGVGSLEVDWTVAIPDIPERRGGARGGRKGARLFQVAQWYPQVAKYDDLRGWDLEPHLGASEFYNNFGAFDVTLEVPARWLVGATGTLANSGEVLNPVIRERLGHVLDSDSTIAVVTAEERGVPVRGVDGSDIVVRGVAPPGDARQRWHFVADTVNDFAWAASPDYVWDATRATIPGRGPIPVNLLYLPDHARYKTTGPIARHALEFYSSLWFPYAFPQFTQIDGPEGGMEYPMLTFSGPGFGVTDHEIGHEWWPMMVGTNETWYGWMDEGFNEYMNILSDAAFRRTPPVLDTLGGNFGRASGTEMIAPMMWDNNYGGSFTSFVTYEKAPMMLSMLGAIVGDSAVATAMQSYARDWRFRHPSPWDFMFAMNRELGQNLDWFWYYWLFTTESSDGSIASVTTRPGRTVVTVVQAGEMPSPVVLRVEFAPTGPAIRPMKNAVIDGNVATVTWPVSVWFGGTRSFAAPLAFGGRKIERIVLDPQRRFPDRDVTDNVWPRIVAP